MIGRPWVREPGIRATLAGAALAAGVPFVLYYAARLNAAAVEPGGDRAFGLALSLDSLRVVAGEWIARMRITFAGTGGVAALLALAAMPVMTWRAPQVRWPVAWSMAIGAGLVLFFALDQASFRWAGYFRFLMYSLPFLCAGLVALGHLGSRRGGVAVALALFALQTPGALAAVRRSAGPATDRNFYEHYDAPIVFPLKAVVTEASAAGWLPPGARIVVNQADPFVTGGRRLNLDFLPLGELPCQCREDRPYVLALFVRYTNLNAPFAHTPLPDDWAFGAPREREQLWRTQRLQARSCVALMRAACAHVIERVEGGELVVAFGLHGQRQ